MLDFGCGLSQRSRPQSASSSNLSGRTILLAGSHRLSSLARGSGFRLRAPAALLPRSLTPPKRLKLLTLSRKRFEGRSCARLPD